MFIISCFHFNTEETAVYTFGVTFFIVHTGYVTDAISNNAGDFFELTWLIYQFNEKAGGTARIQKPSVDNTGQAGNINVAA